MTATAHALVAALIAAKFVNPAVALPLAFASHFVLDYIPHWDEATHRREKKTNRLFGESALDFGIGITSSFALYGIILGQTDYLLLIATLFFSLLPDFLMAPYIMFHNTFPLFRWAYVVGRECNRRLDKPWGVITQIIAVLVVYLTLFKIF